MKKILVLSQETFSLYWTGKKQPAGVTPKSIIEYINASLSYGVNININQFTIASNYKTYTFDELKNI